MKKSYGEVKGKSEKLKTQNLSIKPRKLPRRRSKAIEKRENITSNKDKDKDNDNITKGTENLRQQLLQLIANSSIKNDDVLFVPFPA